MFKVIKNDGECCEPLRSCKYILHAYTTKDKSVYAKINLKSIVGYFISRRKGILK